MPPLLGGRSTSYVGLRPGYSGLLAILLNMSLLATVKAVRIGCERGVHEGWCRRRRVSCSAEGVLTWDAGGGGTGGASCCMHQGAAVVEPAQPIAITVCADRRGGGSRDGTGLGGERHGKELAELRGQGNELAEWCSQARELA